MNITGSADDIVLWILFECDGNGNDELVSLCTRVAGRPMTRAEVCGEFLKLEDQGRVSLTYPDEDRIVAWIADGVERPA